MTEKTCKTLITYSLKNNTGQNSQKTCVIPMGITRVDVETFYIISTKEVEVTKGWAVLEKKYDKNA